MHTVTLKDKMDYVFCPLYTYQRGYPLISELLRKCPLFSSICLLEVAVHYSTNNVDNHRLYSSSRGVALILKRRFLNSLHSLRTHCLSSSVFAFMDRKHDSAAQTLKARHCVSLLAFVQPGRIET